MSEYPVIKKQVPIGSILNFTDDGEKFEVIACDGIQYGEKGWILKCVCLESPSGSKIGEKYEFDDRVFRHYNGNNIVIEDAPKYVPVADQHPFIIMNQSIGRSLRDSSKIPFHQIAIEDNGNAHDEDESIKSLIDSEVAYIKNLNDDTLIQASYCNKEQNVTINGVSDCHDGALDDLINNMRNSDSFDMASFLATTPESLFNWEEAADTINRAANEGERAYLMIEAHQHVPITVMEQQFDSAFSDFYGWTDEERRTLKYLSIGDTIDLTEQWKVICIKAIPPEPKMAIALDETPLFHGDTELSENTNTLKQ